MSRSVIKGFYYPDAVERKVEKAHRTGDMSPIRVMARAATITDRCIGLAFAIHNGKLWIPLRVTPEHVGRKFGEFAETRKFGGHSGDKKSPQNKKSPPKKK